jgi:hypothetical protein
MTRRALPVVASTLLLCAAAAAAQPAQSVRVVAAAAAVRVAASDGSQVLVAPPVGADFELTRTEGEWHMVLLPPDAHGLRRYGYIRTRDAVVRPAPASPAPEVASPVAADWNQRMRAADGRKAGGRAKFFAGWGALAGGAAILTAVTSKMLNSEGPNDECSANNPCPEYAWAAGGAVGLFVTGGLLIKSGRRQVAAANEEIIRLKTELANARPSARLAIPLGEGERARGTLVLGGGRGLQAQYQLQW